ncbi:MAG: hypothetical protein ACFFCE_01630 [Promethearchaeota archaeon]
MYSDYKNTFIEGCKLETPYTISWTCPDCQEESEALISDDLDIYNIHEITKFLVFCSNCKKEWSMNIQVDLYVTIIS